MKQWLDHFPRLKDLYTRTDSAHKDNFLTAYFESVRLLPAQQVHIKSLEKNLECLDAGAWEKLRNKVLPCVCQKDPRRGWQQFWNHLNECRGYVLLAERGYRNIRFVPCTSQRTCELEGQLNGTRGLVEVKTINRSDEDTKRGNPAIEAKDILDLAAIVKRLSGRADPVSDFLWQHLDCSTQKLLVQHQQGAATEKETKLALAQGLTSMRAENIYEKQRFQGIQLRTLTAGYLRERPQAIDLTYLNRWLLEDAYDKELAKMPPLVVDVRLAMPPAFKTKLESTIENARQQLAQYPGQVEKKFVLLVINRDLGCTLLNVQGFVATHQTREVELVCQIGDI